MVKIIKVDPLNINLSILVEASNIILNGGLVIYPTDTVYGLAANPLDVKAVERAIKVKGRGLKPMPVIVSSINAARELVYINDYALKLMKKFWPGPLTIVLPKKEFVPNILTANSPNLGVRMPNHPIAIKLAELCYGYILGTSANISGRVSPRNVYEAIRQIGEFVDLAIDAGPCQIGVPSTVVDLSAGHPKIIREGIITKKEIEEALE